jgi:hypothetical protein
MFNITSWKLTSWVRWIGLATLLLALAGLGLSFINAPAAQTIAVGLVIFANRLALVAATLGVVACWQRRSWGWVAALALAGVITLLSGPISDAFNSNFPFIVGPILVGALGLAATGLPSLPRITGSSTR